MAAPGATVHSTRRVEVCQCSEKSFVFSARLYAGLPVQDPGIVPWSPSRRGCQVLQATACASNSMRAVGESRVIARPSFNPVSARKPSCSAA